jgi:hypothetical protein
MNMPRRKFLQVSGAFAGGLLANSIVPGVGAGAVITPGPVGGYQHWRDSARRLLEPLAALMVPGQCSLPLIGQPSEYTGPAADRLESLVRPLLLAAHWLQTPPAPHEEEFHRRLSGWFRAALVIGTDRSDPQYFGPDANYHQFHVEIGLLCIGLQLAPAALWDPLTKAQQDQLARWISTARGSGIVNNNHYFMGVHILEFLAARGYGRRSDRVIVDEFMHRLELMHRGGGWFEDGINQAYDHYNAFAFHFYGLMWARLHGRRDPERAQRWREWARMFVRDYQHFFAASGEHPAFGRSLTYRFNTINVFGMALAEGCCDLAPGMLRRLCTRNLDFFLTRPIYQSQGVLSLGWTDEFPALAEKYSCPASPYWAAKGFSPLLLPPDHAFWTAPEEPMPAERGDHVCIVRPAGLIARSHGGDVEILNAGSQVSNGNLRYGAWKWSKTAYHTANAFTLAFPADGNWSLDSALTMRLDDGSVFGRHSTVAVELEPTHLVYSAQFGGTMRQVNTALEAGVWWRAGWLLQVHACDPQQPCVLRLGGYALPSRQGRLEFSAEGGLILGWGDEGRGTALQPLAGFQRTDWEKRLDDNTPRTHIAAPYHATPLALTDRLTKPAVLAALVWTGTDRAEAQPWRVVSARAGAWTLQHPRLGEWKIEHWLLPDLPAVPA